MENRIRKRVLRVGLLFLAIVALVAAVAIPIYAATPAASNNPGFHVVQGKVDSVKSPKFDVTTPNEQSLTVSTDSNTQYYLIPLGKAQGYVNKQVAADNREDRKAGLLNPNRAAQLKELHIPANWRSNLGWLQIFDNQASFDNIAKGDRVIVRADDANLAKQVLIIKAPVNRTVKGSIVLNNDTPPTITITPTDGSGAVTLNVVDTTRIMLKGQTSMTGYAVALYNSTNSDALVVNIQATEPTQAATPANLASNALKSIAVTPVSPPSLAVGGTRQFTATAAYANGKTANVTSKVDWASANTDVATISATGLAKGVAAGTTTITASLSGISSPEVTLTVANP
jgi:hypothetical protein